MPGVIEKVEGLKDLDDALATLGSKTLVKGVLRRIGLKALAPFVEDAQALAPIDADPANSPKRAPGTLKRSYHAGTKLNKRQASLARKEGKSDVEVYAGTNDPAGIQTEFGNAHQAPQPHARPAWDGAQRQALEIVKNDMMAEINKTADRAAARARRLAAK